MVFGSNFTPASMKIRPKEITKAKVKENQKENEIFLNIYPLLLNILNTTKGLIQPSCSLKRLLLIITNENTESFTFHCRLRCYFAIMGPFLI